MNRRSFLNATAAVSIAAALPSRSTLADGAQLATQKPGNERSPETILLKDYRPKSLHKVPVTEVAKAKFPVFRRNVYLIDCAARGKLST